MPVVTNIGAILSHAAVVATRNATVVLSDENRVEVDGDIGVVRLLASE